MKKALKTSAQANLDSALIAAIKSSETDSVVSLLQQGADPNTFIEADLWGFGALPTSAFMLAITWFCRRETVGFNFEFKEEFNESLVRALIEGGASLKKASPYDEPPLYTVVRFGDLIPRRYALVAFMLDHRADIDEQACRRTALCAACADGDKDMVLLLLDRGADVNPRRLGTSPLIIAVQARQKDIVAELLARGADVNYRTGTGVTALSLAQGKRRAVVEIRKMLEVASFKNQVGAMS